MNKPRKLQLARPRTRQAGNRKREAIVSLALRLDAQTADQLDEADENGVEPAAVWVQVAEEGDYKGYAGGAFKFDRAAFAEMVKNFREHPSYKAVNGVGAADVVPWDFHHASEHAATDGSIPVAGAPAQGWVQELDVRQGADGKAQLWALTRWLPLARQYIRAGQYKWASVTVVFHATDPKSGKDVGHLLTSIALTNQPFIEGMQQLAAERDGLEQKRLVSGPGGGWYEPARDAQDALEQMKRLLGLSAISGAAEVIAQVIMLNQWVTMGGAPLGVDLECIVSCMRTIFNLPALSGNDEVFAETQRLLSSLLEQELPESVPPPPPGAAPNPAAPPPPAMPAAATRNTTMNIAKLAARLGVQATAEAVFAALEQKLDLLVKLSKLLTGKEDAADGVLLDAGEKSVGVKDRLAAILKALGVEDSAGAIDKIGAMFKQVTDLEAAMPELKELREFKQAADDAEVEGDVDAAIASKGYPEDLRDALRLERKADKAKFQAKYPRAKAPAAPAPKAASPAAAPHLQRTLAVAPGGAERRIVSNPDGSISMSTLSRAGKGETPEGVETVIDLTKTVGPNRFARLTRYLQAQDAKLSFDDATARAHELMRSKTVRIVDAA